MSQQQAFLNNPSGLITIDTVTGNIGGPVGPSAGGNLNLIGSGNIYFTGTPGTNTQTGTLVGTTNHAVQIGNASGSLTSIAVGATGTILQGNVGADPTWSTATYPSTTTLNSILYSSSSNVVGQIPVVIDGVLISSHATGVPSFLANGTAGFVLTAQSGAPPAWAAIPSGGMTWTDNSGAFAAVKSNGYFITTTSTSTLPASPSEGDTIAFNVDTANILTIQANTGQFIRLSSSISSIAGTLVNTAQGDAITLIYRASGTTWHAQSAIGVWGAA